MENRQGLGTARAVQTSDDEMMRVTAETAATDIGQPAPVSADANTGSTNMKAGAASRMGAMKDKLTSFDWREQVSARPAAISLGVLGVGALAGYALGGIFSERKRGTSYALDSKYQDESADAESDYTSPDDNELSVDDATSNSMTLNSTLNSTASTSRGVRHRKSAKPGLFAKFKGTHVFSRLQDEAGKIGNQLVDELSRIGNEVAVPAMTRKINSALEGKQAS